MNDLLEKARQMYPKGTKFRCVYTEEKHISTGNYELGNYDVLIRSFKTSNPYFFGPNSIRIL